MLRRYGPNLIVPGFGLWTLFVWGGRLRNLWMEPGGLAGAGRWSLAGSVAFTALALAVLGAWFLGRSTGLGRSGPPARQRYQTRYQALPGYQAVQRFAVSALAALTVIVWSIRAVEIAAEDHPLGFIAVHVGLAAISVVLAVLAIRRVRPAAADSSSGRSSEPGRFPVG